MLKDIIIVDYGTCSIENAPFLRRRFGAVTFFAQRCSEADVLALIHFGAKTFNADTL